MADETKPDEIKPQSDPMLSSSTQALEQTPSTQEPVIDLHLKLPMEVYKDLMERKFEIWGLNSLFEAIPRWDRWFEVHNRGLFNLDTNKEIGYGLTRTGEPYMS